MSLFTFTVVSCLIFAFLALAIHAAQVTIERDEARAALHRDRSMRNHPSNRNPQ